MVHRSYLKGIILSFLLLLLPALVSAQAWKIDPDHSAAHFSIQHLMIAQVRGMFPDVQGTVTFDGAVPTSFYVTIGVNSVDTGVAKRDEHLKTPDFFDAAKYPQMTFVSSKVAPAADGYDVTGTMTIKGTAQDVVLHVSGLNRDIVDPWQHTRRGATAHFILNRQDYGVSWNAPLGADGVLVGNDVDIVVDLEVLKP